MMRIGELTQKVIHTLLIDLTNIFFQYYFIVSIKEVTYLFLGYKYKLCIKQCSIPK